MERRPARSLIRPSIFDSLNDIDAATARRRFMVQRAGPGEVLIREGEVGRSLGCLVQGELEIRAGGVVVGRMSPGALLGELGLFEDSVRTATVVAPQGAEVWVLGREEYEELRDTLHPIGAAIERAVIDAQVLRIEQIGAKVASLGLGDAVDEPPSSWLSTLRRFFGGGALRPTSSPVAPALAASQLFRDAPPMVVERIAEQVQAVSCDAGAVLCVEGETGEQMFVLASGSVSVVVRAEGAPHRVARLAPGDAFGMVSLARGGRRMSSCVADGPAVVLRLDAAGWAALIDEPTLVGSAFRRGVIRAFAEQLRASNTQLSEWERGL